MNIRLWFFILPFVFQSCKTDNFYDTERILSTDKAIYNIEDNIRITMKIIPQKNRKEIRVYDNYKNIDFSFSIINDKNNIYNGYWSNSSGESLPQSEIKELYITKENPFEVEFVGKIDVDKDTVYIHFPKLNNYSVKFKKGILEDANTSIRIHGICYPINPEPGAPIDDYFNIVNFKVVIK